MRAKLAFLGAALLVASAMVAAMPAGGRAQPMLVEVPLMALNNSGQSGSVTLQAMGNQTKVTLRVMGLPAGADQPAHIHEGTCASPNPAPAFPLNNVRGADTETIVAVPLRDLMTRPYLINTHKSMQELSVYTTCADLSW